MSVRVRIEGDVQAIEELTRRQALVSRAAGAALKETGLRMLGRAKDSFNKPGNLRRQTGNLSRSLVMISERFEWGTRVAVGSAKEPLGVLYARIHEFGGMIREHWVFPKKKKWLRWTQGVTRLGEVASLGFGTTRKQAFNWKNARRLRGGRYSKGTYDPGDIVFAKKAKIPARYQRARPFLTPAFDAEKELLADRIRSRVSRALQGSTEGEGT